MTDPHPEQTIDRDSRRQCRNDRYAHLDPLERKARRRAGAKLGLYIHAAVFVAVNLLLLAIALVAAPAGHSPRWPLFPLLGWGIGLMFHALAVLSKSHTDGLYQKMVENERQRLNRAQH